MPTSIHGTNGITFNDGSTQTTRPAVGFRNRIINGDMRIDQRNAGEIHTPVANTYSIDRWNFQLSQASKLTAQRQSITNPQQADNNYYCLNVTSSSGYSVTSSDYFLLGQFVEGFNCADLGWGTSGAKSITISFWVYSSLTGSFGGSVQNSAITRSYPFSYTISSANTWEKKTITIAGDTSGTWVTGSGLGIRLYFGLGTGSTVSGTSGSWASANYLSATGAISVVGTNGATFYITGVQLEAGSTATEFERRPYGTEVALCQRYYYRQTRTSGASNGINNVFSYIQMATNAYQTNISFPVTMRSAPSFESSSASTFFYHVNGVANSALTSISIDASSVDSARIVGATSYTGTQGFCGQLAMANSSTAYLGFSSEL